MSFEHSAVHTESELRRMLRAALVRATDEWQMHAVGEPTYGWHDRSIGSAIQQSTGPRRWLRIVWARSEWARGLWWTGNHDAADIEIDTKPSPLRAHEWVEGPLTFRAELMTWAHGKPCSATPELRSAPHLDDVWWSALSTSLATVATTQTTRMSLDPWNVRHRIAVFFGHEVDVDPSRWLSSHGDLHWNNLHRGPLAIVDWEAWGLAPRGYDAAFLLAHSLAVPAVAAEIIRTFRDDLDSQDGVTSQLYAFTKLLTRADGGEHAELIAPIHRRVDALLNRAPHPRPLPSGATP